MVFGLHLGHHKDKHKAKKEKERSGSTKRAVQSQSQLQATQSSSFRDAKSQQRRHSAANLTSNGQATPNHKQRTNVRHSTMTSVNPTSSRATSGARKSTSRPVGVATSTPRHGSPLKSAMKPSKYRNNEAAISQSTTSLPVSSNANSMAMPLSPRAKHKYIGPIDVDDIPSTASLSTATGTLRGGNSIDVDDLPLYRAKSTPNVVTHPSTLKKSSTHTHSSALTANHKNTIPPPAVVSPTPKSPPQTYNSKVPTAILQRSSSNHSVSKSVPTFGSNVQPPNQLSITSKDDMSIISLDNMSKGDLSVMSRVSVHMDHFLAEMALADNAQLEQLAVEEMKHRQIIPQKIKKLNKKIGVLNEEKQVLVGLIDQLQELVDNQEEAKKRRRAKRKEKKKLKKQHKKQQKQQAKQQQEAAAKAKETEDTDSDEEFLQQQRTTKATTTRDADSVTVPGGDGDSVGGTHPWWKDDKTTTKPPAVLDASDPILGSGAVDSENEDEFAKLWDASSGSEHEGEEDDDDDDESNLDIPTLDAAHSLKSTPSASAAGATSSNNTAGKVAAGVGAAAVGAAASIAAVTSARNKKKKDDKPKVEAFALVETLPDKPEDDELAKAEAASAPPLADDSDSDEERNLLLPAALGGAALGAAAASSSSSPKRTPPTSLRSLRLSNKSGLSSTPMDDDSTAGGSTRKASQRFSVFLETDTYLPGHMPGSQGNTPEGSERGPEKDSNSDSDSDSDSDDTKSSNSSVANTQMVLEEEEDEAQPSSSHHLAKQLMARLKQQEKQQEQEELQKNLQGIIRRNSLRRLSDSQVDLDRSELEHIFHEDVNKRSSMPNILMASAVSQDSHDFPINAELGYNTSYATPISPVPVGAKSHDEQEDNSNVAELRKELELSKEELEKLREERTFQEVKVKQLLAALENKFDDGDDDDEDEEELEEADDINDSFDQEDLPKKADDTTDTESKKRKRMQTFLTQKVDECAELTATVEQLKERVSQKQTKIEELQAAKPAESARAIPTDDTSDSIPNPPNAVVSSLSADLSKDSLQHQLLERTAECFDLQEDIKKLEVQLQEKDQQYQEVHRDLFTANLALGVEVDRKATAQQALDEKCQEFEAVQKENEELTGKMSKFEERIEALDDELLSRATMLEEMKSKHDDGLNVVASELETTKAELVVKTNALDGLRQKVSDLEREKDDITNKGSANDQMVVELRNLLNVESDQREQLELKVNTVEQEKDELRDDMERVKKENEINKALLQDKKEYETQDGKASANIQAEVEQLIAENAELKKTLSGVQESEASMKKERERLVANATNMSIMLADSRAKVDFLQMQLEDYKNGPLSNSEHGMKSQSEHGFADQKRGFRKLLAGSNASVSGGSSHGGTGILGDSSERSVGSLGGSQSAARSARFRNFLQNRMGGGAGAADS